MMGALEIIRRILCCKKQSPHIENVENKITLQDAKISNLEIRVRKLEDSQTSEDFCKGIHEPTKQCEETRTTQSHGDLTDLQLGCTDALQIAKTRMVAKFHIDDTALPASVKNPQNPPSSPQPTSASSPSPRTKSTRIKLRRVSTATQRSLRARGSFHRRSISILGKKITPKMVATWHIDDTGLPASVKRLEDLSDHVVSSLLRAYVREYVQVKDSNKMYYIRVSFPKRPSSCPNLVMASTRLILNAIKYMQFNDADKQAIVKKWGFIGSDATNLLRLLSGVNLNTLKFCALPNGARFAPNDPIIMATGTWATVHLLGIAVKNLIEGPTRIASKASALKQVAGLVELYYNTAQTDEGEFNTLWASYGGFSGSTHENASIRHRVLKLNLGIRDAVSNEIKEKIDEADFPNSCRNAFNEVVTDIHLISDTYDQPDEFYTGMVKEMNETLAKKTRFMTIKNNTEVLRFAAQQLALMHEGVNHFSLCVVGDHKRVMDLANEVFGATFQKYPKYGNVEIIGALFNDAEFEACAKLFSKVLVADTMISQTPAIECNLKYSSVVDGPQYADIYRGMSDGLEINVVTLCDQVPNVIENKLAVTGSAKVVNIDRGLTKLTRAYVWNDYTGYPDETPGSVSEMHARTLPKNGAPPLKGYGHCPNPIQSPHH